MTDYNKLTVVKLKEELKQRGLQQTGLKAALIARLTEYDAQSAAVPPNKTTKDAGDVPEVTEDQVETTDALPDSNGTLEPAPEKLGDVPGPEIVGSEVDQEEKESQAPQVQATPTIEVRESEKDVPSQKDLTESKPEDDSTKAPPMLQDKELDVTATPDIQNLEQIPQETAVPHSLGTPTSQADAPAILPPSTQTSVSNEEVIEDSRKRKRRSKSLTPSTQDTALKKAKASDGSPIVKLPEDREPQREEDETTRAEVEPLDVAKVNGKSSDDVVMEEPEEDEPAAAKDEATEQEPSATETAAVGLAAKESQRRTSSAQIDTLQSPVKASPSDTRFKGLFSASKPTEALPPQELYTDMEDRDISPALHPATSALYIRNFMRPLQPQSLKDHLAALARPPTTSPSGEIITDFFLDTIRTHCLVRFTTVAAASRVRIALHDRVWPDQKTRKPLWIDFVPEEKLQKWIDVEQASGGNRNQPAKRWEVVYEQEDGGVAAYLQEADGNGPPRTFFPNGQRADSRPQPADAKPVTSITPKPTGDVGKGFKALDDLFKSTDAKPKLYYQPVSAAIANRRLDKLAAGRGGGRNDEMRRFSFEDEAIVDKGPEFGAGWRGGARGGGRGGYSGYGRGGGGGYRGDSWRGGR
ncbi:hypothetical protein MMC30_004759 [Trapelia coarctata]|nr:hypothetical protein [Trapelia coarctata]